MRPNNRKCNEKDKITVPSDVYKKYRSKPATFPIQYASVQYEKKFQQIVRQPFLKKMRLLIYRNEILFYDE
jgi:RNA-binding protein YlmH